MKVDYSIIVILLLMIAGLSWLSYTIADLERETDEK